MMASLGRIDLRDLLPDDVHSQGSRPLCIPFAVSATHEGARSAAGGAVRALAPEAVWSNATSRGATSANGMYLVDADTALRIDGQPHLHDWPYNPHVAPEEAEPTPESLTPPPWLQARTVTVPLHLDNVEQAIEDALANRQAVVLILDVSNAFQYPSAGIIDVSDGDKPEGLHAVTCVGALTHPTVGRCLLIKNSWGAWWGLGGYAWVTLRYVARFGYEAAVVRV